MDNHSAQRTPRIMELHGELGLIPLFTAPNCTDCVSPVDHHVGHHIQQHMARKYGAEVQNNPEIWIASSHDQEIEDAECKSAKSRRILMARWLSEVRAWTDLTENNSTLIENAFVHTGFKIAKDGSEDDLIKLQGWSGKDKYRFRTTEGVRL